MWEGFESVSFVCSPSSTNVLGVTHSIHVAHLLKYGFDCGYLLPVINAYAFISFSNFPSTQNLIPSVGLWEKNILAVIRCCITCISCWTKKSMWHRSSMMFFCFSRQLLLIGGVDPEEDIQNFKLDGWGLLLFYFFFLF